MNYLIEIAVTDYATAFAAVQGGAGRIELCCALSEGGITPSGALVRQCRKDFTLPLFPIIRPRGGDFLYTGEEFRIMSNDVLACREWGCDGVVTGILQRDGTVDQRRTGILRELAYPMELTFHRAFDRCKDPFQAMEQLVELGCDRILTSGQQPTAVQALPLIKQLVTASDSRIIIMPGSGIRPGNIKQVAQETGALEFHASLRTTRASKMEYLHPAFTGTDDYLLPALDENSVRALKEAVSDTTIAG